MHIERLEDRCTPVSFRFSHSDSSFFTPEVLSVVEQAGRAVGQHLRPADINVHLMASGDIGNALARGGPTPYGGMIVFDVGRSWHYGLSTVGLEGHEYDLFSVASHELMHVLGVGTVDGWEDGSVSRGVPIDDDGVHFDPSTGAVASGFISTNRRYYPTDTDFAALSDLGWAHSRPTQPVSFLSIAGPDGIVRQYLIKGEQFLYLGSTGRLHITFGDMNFDGVPDIRVTPVGFGIDYAIDGRSGGLLDPPAFTFGVRAFITSDGNLKQI